MPTYQRLSLAELRSATRTWLQHLTKQRLSATIAQLFDAAYDRDNALQIYPDDLLTDLDHLSTSARPRSRTTILASFLRGCTTMLAPGEWAAAQTAFMRKAIAQRVVLDLLALEHAETVASVEEEEALFHRLDIKVKSEVRLRWDAYLVNDFTTIENAGRCERVGSRDLNHAEGRAYWGGQIADWTADNSFASSSLLEETNETSISPMPTTTENEDPFAIFEYEPLGEFESAEISEEELNLLFGPLDDSGTVAYPGGRPKWCPGIASSLVQATPQVDDALPLSEHQDDLGIDPSLSNVQH